MNGNEESDFDLSLQTKLVQGDEKVLLKLAISKEEFAYQIYQQKLWNLHQIIGSSLSKENRPFRFDVITVGYYGKPFSWFLELLEASEMKLLIDVRKVPGSKYDSNYNKSSLMDNLSFLGIQYEHIPELGVSEELRILLQKQKITMKEFFIQYDTEILTEEKIDHLQHLVKDYGVIGILCAEISPRFCHRHRIALALKKRGYNTIDI